MTYVFFLGGHDLEMLAIRELLEKHAPGRFHDARLTWGAKASAYCEEIRDALRHGDTPVLIELENDLALKPGTIAAIDHHGPDAGNVPTVLEQAFKLLELPATAWTRRLALIAANDRGHIKGLLAAGATPAEIREIRAADRQAQGITPEEEAQAAAAVRAREELVNGCLTVLHLPASRTSAAADLMEPALGGPGYQNLLIFSPGELNFFGKGDLVLALHREFPGGWCGGDLPRHGFWGHTQSTPMEQQAITRLQTWLLGASPGQTTNA